MKAIIVHDVVCDRHLVYFYDLDEVTGERYAFLDGRIVECQPGCELPVSLRLTSREFAALQTAMHPAPTGPTVDGVAFSALEDARSTRDRLLTLVETVTNDHYTPRG